MNNWRRCLSQTAGIVAIAFAVLWLGTLVHESGHALVALTFGARVEEVNVVGLNIYPALRIHYQPDKFGYVRFDRTLPSPQVEYMRVAGSLSTLAVALLAQGVLWGRPPRRTWPRLIVIAFCFSWIDVFWHTSLALLGLRRRAFAEAYNALVSLGAPGWLVSMAVVGISALLLVLTLVRWRQLARPTLPSRPVLYWTLFLTRSRRMRIRRFLERKAAISSDEAADSHPPRAK